MEEISKTCIEKIIIINTSTHSSLNNTIPDEWILINSKLNWVIAKATKAGECVI